MAVITIEGVPGCGLLERRRLPWHQQRGRIEAKSGDDEGDDGGVAWRATQLVMPASSSLSR